jgi:hypothetical protein
MNFPDVRATVKNWPFVKWWLKKPMDKASIISDVAATLGVSADWLDGVIAFESRYDPQAVAGYPYNQKAVDAGTERPRYARGLIQFIDSTAQDLGFGSAQDLVNRQPDFESQMRGAVLKYFQKKAPFTSKSDLYMAVFYPAYRKKAADTVFPDSVLRANPGINTPQDYIDHADRVVASIRLIPTVAAGGAALLAGDVVLYLFMKGA